MDGRGTARTVRRGLVGAGALALLTAAPAGAATTPTIQVSPDRGLIHQQQVTVTGTGLTPACGGWECLPIGMLQCVRGAPITTENWDQRCVYLGTAQTTANGYQGAVRVRVAFTPERAGSAGVACGANGCEVVAGGAANGRYTFVSAPITFSK